jgi:hypothetical protein
MRFRQVAPKLNGKNQARIGGERWHAGVREEKHFERRHRFHQKSIHFQDDNPTEISV